MSWVRPRLPPVFDSIKPQSNAMPCDYEADCGHYQGKDSCSLALRNPSLALNRTRSKWGVWICDLHMNTCTYRIQFDLIEPYGNSLQITPCSSSTSSFAIGAVKFPLASQPG